MSSQPSPALAERLAARLRVAVQHPVRIDAGEPEGDEAGARLEPEPGGGRLARDEHGGGAVDDLARVARGDHPVGEERRLERGELLRGGVAARRLVDGEEHGRTGGRHLDRNDLVLEAAVVDRRDRAPVRLERVGVERLAREFPLGGERLGGDPLRDDLPALEQLVREVAAVRAHRHARHHLDAGRDDDVELAGPDRGGRIEVRLHRGAALAVDGRPTDRLGPAGDHRRHPADVPALLADLRHAAHLHVLDLGRIEVVAGDEAVQHLSRELVAARPRKGAVPPPDRAANGVDDQRFRGHRTEHRLRGWPRRRPRRSS